MKTAVSVMTLTMAALIVPGFATQDPVQRVERNKQVIRECNMRGNLGETRTPEDCGCTSAGDDRRLC